MDPIFHGRFWENRKTFKKPSLKERKNSPISYSKWIISNCRVSTTKGHFFPFWPGSSASSPARPPPMGNGIPIVPPGQPVQRSPPWPPFKTEYPGRSCPAWLGGRSGMGFLCLKFLCFYGNSFYCIEYMYIEKVFKGINKMEEKRQSWSIPLTQKLSISPTRSKFLLSCWL